MGFCYNFNVLKFICVYAFTTGIKGVNGNFWKGVNL